MLGGGGVVGGVGVEGGLGWGGAWQAEVRWVSYQVTFVLVRIE